MTKHSSLNEKKSDIHNGIVAHSFDFHGFVEGGGGKVSKYFGGKFFSFLLAY